MMHPDKVNVSIFLCYSSDFADYLEKYSAINFKVFYTSDGYRKTKYGSSHRPPRSPSVHNGNNALPRLLPLRRGRNSSSISFRFRGKSLLLRVTHCEGSVDGEKDGGRKKMVSSSEPHFNSWLPGSDWVSQTSKMRRFEAVVVLSK